MRDEELRAREGEGPVEPGVAARQEPHPPGPFRGARRVRRGQQDPAWVRVTLTLAAVAVVVLLIGVPVVHVFWQAFGNGVGAYFHALFGKPATRHAILLTLIVAPTAVVLNLVFGVAAAWALARFRFRGRAVLLALIDLPFAVSPVVARLVVLLGFRPPRPPRPW